MPPRPGHPARRRNLARILAEHFEDSARAKQARQFERWWGALVEVAENAPDEFVLGDEDEAEVRRISALERLFRWRRALVSPEMVFEGAALVVALGFWAVVGNKLLSGSTEDLTRLAIVALGEVIGLVIIVDIVTELFAEGSAERALVTRMAVTLGVGCAAFIAAIVAVGATRSLESAQKALLSTLDPHQQFLPVWAGALILAGSFLVVGLLLQIAFNIGVAWFSRLIMLNHPRIFAVGHLLEVVKKLEGGRAKPIGKARDEALVDANAAAYCIRHGLPTEAKGLPGPFMREVQKHWDEAARAVEDFSLALVLPSGDTSSLVSQRAAATALSLLRMRDGELTRVAASPLTQGRVLASCVRVVRALVVGLLPLAIVLGMKQYNVAIPPELHSSVVIFGVAWAVSTVLLLIDPQISSRIEGAKGLLSIMRPGGSGKDD